MYDNNNAKVVREEMKVYYCRPVTFYVKFYVTWGQTVIT